MSVVLVTGANGFVGRHAVAGLAEHGFTVHAAARGRPVDLPAVWHKADLLDSAARRTLMDTVRPSHLLHLAWEARHGYFWEAPENLDWVAATLDLVRLFHKAGGVRAVFAGSCAEYDWSPDGIGDGMCREHQTPCRPGTLYGFAKVASHELVAAYAARTGLSYAWGRLFYLYGQGETQTRLMPSVVRALIAGQTAAIGHGNVIRDFIDSRDAGAALTRVLAGAVEGPVNIASGQGIAIADIAHRLARLIGKEHLLEFADRPTDASNPACLVADVTRLRKEVGFAPSIDLDKGLADVVAWWQQEMTAGSADAAQDN